MFKYTLEASISELDGFIQSHLAQISMLSKKHAVNLQIASCCVKTGDIGSVENIADASLASLENDSEFGAKVSKILHDLWRTIKEFAQRIVMFFKRMALDTRDLRKTLNSITDSEWTRALYGSGSIAEQIHDIEFIILGTGSSDIFDQALTLDKSFDPLMQLSVKAYEGLEKIVEKSDSSSSYSDYPAEAIRVDFERVTDEYCSNILNECKKFGMDTGGFLINIKAERMYRDLELNISYHIGNHDHFTNAEKSGYHITCKEDAAKILSYIDRANAVASDVKPMNLPNENVQFSNNLRTRYVSSAMVKIAKFCSNLLVVRTKNLPTMFNILRHEEVKLRKVINLVTSSRLTGKGKL